MMMMMMTVPGNMHVKFEVRSFDGFGAISINSQKLEGHLTGCCVF